MTKVKRGKRTPLKVIAAVLAVVVTVLFVSAGMQIAEHAHGYVSDYDARDYIYSAESGRFGSLYATAIRDMNKDAKRSAEVDEYRALAFYYEQAVLEQAYRAAGDSAKADEFADKMVEYETQLGTVKGKAESVRQQVSVDR